MNARSDFPGRSGAAAPRWPDPQRPGLTVAHPACREMPRTDLPVHNARQLTGATGQAQIVLDGQIYALRITRAGKLILTK